MKFRYILPFLAFFNAHGQLKFKSGTKELDVKSRYIDIAAKDTFGLTDAYNIKGMIKAKYEGSSAYFTRNGLLNHHFGEDLDLKWLKAYHNQSKQSIKSENSQIQISPIGEIFTQTTILNDDKTKESGVTLGCNNFFISYETAADAKKIHGQTMIRVNEDLSFSPFSLEFKNKTEIYGAGFDNGYIKLIRNKQNNNNFDNHLIKANYSGVNIYHGKETAGFITFEIFNEIFINPSYDEKLKINISTSEYADLNRRDFERRLENKLRLVPRGYDSNLETKRDYLEDMFFTKDYSFSIDKDHATANINFDNFLFHYSEESKKAGLKYKFFIGTYDFKQKELKAGIFLD